MREKKTISEAVIKRLPRYYTCLSDLTERGETRVSSERIAELLHYTASQVRQDLHNFGEFGQQGYGYDPAYLREQITSIIGLNREHNMIVIGAGNIGRALTGYRGFQKDGFFVRAVFDTAISSPAEQDGVQYLPISALEEYVESRCVDIAVIAVPKDCAQQAAELAVRAGINAIWNFAPVDLKCPGGVAVENINMSESLYMLSYKNKNRREE